MMEGKYSETYTAEDDDAMEVDDGSSNNVKSGIDNKNQTVIDNSVLDEESIENNIILLPSNHLEVVSHDNDPSNNNVVNISKQIATQIENVITRSSSPVTGKNHSSITIDTRSRSSLQAASSSVTCFNDLSVLNRNSKLTTALSSTTTPSLDSTDSARNPMSLTDTSHSNTVQRSSSVESTSNITPSLEQPITPPQPKQKIAMLKNLLLVKLHPKSSYQRRSFFLRSKTRKKQQQLSTITSFKRKPDGEHTLTVPSTVPLKKKKLNNGEKAGTDYEALTKALGKIPKKTNNANYLHDN
ncbi:unnamed protein product [Rotaria magnacalcarata]|nr:unnamed protein product [Rotaria magnacalcarata]